jgi:acetyl-CoA carboxylase carboxyl transferase subunit alpha
MAKTTFLEFEQPIAELEERIESLRFVQDDSAVDIAEEIDRLQKKSQTLVKDAYAKLTPWQVAQVARHPQRPYTLDYIRMLFTIALLPMTPQLWVVWPALMGNP